MLKGVSTIIIQKTLKVFTYSDLARALSLSPGKNSTRFSNLPVSALTICITRIKYKNTPTKKQLTFFPCCINFFSLITTTKKQNKSNWFYFWNSKEVGNLAISDVLAHAFLPFISPLVPPSHPPYCGQPWAAVSLRVWRESTLLWAAVSLKVFPFKKELSSSCNHTSPNLNIQFMTQVFIQWTKSTF